MCISREIHISAKSIPGVDSTVADIMPRQNSHKLEWALNFSVFQRLSTLVFKPDSELFASRLNKQLQVFITWHREPGYHAVDAFSVLWKPFQCDAFPPFGLISRVL